MKPRLLLLSFAFLFLTASALPAQQTASPTPFRVQYSAQLYVLTEEQFKEVLSEGQLGDREAEYWLALAYHQGIGVAKNQELFFSWMTKIG